VFTARYELSPYIKQTHFVFKGLNVRRYTEMKTLTSSQGLTGIQKSNVTRQCKLDMMLSLFWKVTHCGLAGHQRVEGPCCIHRPHRKLRRKIKQKRWYTSTKLNGAISQIVFIALKTEVGNTSEAPVPTFSTTWYHTPEQLTAWRQHVSHRCRYTATKDTTSTLLVSLWLIVL
jgi:hypothetical protein